MNILYNIKLPLGWNIRRKDIYLRKKFFTTQTNYIFAADLVAYLGPCKTLTMEIYL